MSFTEIRAIAKRAHDENRGLDPQEVAAVINATPAEYRAEAYEYANGTYGDFQSRALIKWAENRTTMERDHADHFAAQQAADAEMRAVLANNPLAKVVTPGEARSDEGEDEWRSGLIPSASEWRANIAESTPADGGYSVPTKVRSEAILQLRQASVFLSAPGLNVIPFDSAKFVLPAIGNWSDATVVAEDAAIPAGTQTFTGPSFDAIKFADLRWATSEVLADSAVDLRKIIGQEMTRTIGQAVDKSAFGNGNGTTALKGLTAAGQSTNTALAAGRTTVKWDDVVDAYAAVLAGGATPTVVWCSADQYGPLLKERESGTTGAYLQGSVTNDPAKAALGLPILASGNLPLRTVLVADASRIFVGVRNEVVVKVSEDAGFVNDRVGFRATYRVGGLAVAEASSVQRITASAT